MSRFINPVPQFILSNGDLAAGGSLFLYEFNTDSLLPIFADNDETIAITNPVKLGDRGEVPDIFFSVNARAVLFDADGNQIFDVQPTASGGGSGGTATGWNSNSTYSQLSIVYGSDGEFYISLVNDNLGNAPSADTDDSEFWTRLELLRFWNAKETYKSGDLAVRNSAIFVSQIDDNTQNDPELNNDNWKDITSADLSYFDNTSSGLAANTVQGAVDEIVEIIGQIAQAFTYSGVLDVSAGDSALPTSPSNGDIYAIGVGGTISVSTNGAAAVPTVQ